MVDNLRGEFDPHRQLRREASVRQYNGAGTEQNMRNAPNNSLRIA
jgi:hypothetical protein